MVVKTNKKLAPLKLSGFTCSQSGLVANKTLTKEQWATVGNSLSTIEAKLSWYVGDWLAASKGEAWGYGDLETVCEEFGLNYSSATSAKSVAMAYEMSRRRQNLTFGHHQEVQGRDVSTRSGNFLRSYPASIIIPIRSKKGRFLCRELVRSRFDSRGQGLLAPAGRMVGGQNPVHLQPAEPRAWRLTFFLVIRKNNWKFIYSQGRSFRDRRPQLNTRQET